jgi:hypothetical protein
MLPFDISMKNLHPSLLTVLVIVPLAVGIAAMVEVGLGFPFSVKSLAIYFGIWSLILLPFTTYKPSRLKSGLYALFVLCLVGLYVIPWNSRKPFLRDFDRIRPGMTFADVETIMEGYMKGTGWPAIDTSNSNPSGTGTLHEVGTDLSLPTTNTPDGELAIRDSIVYRHSNEGQFNSDWGIVKFQDGKVMAKAFMRD